MYLLICAFMYLFKQLYVIVWYFMNDAVIDLFIYVVMHLCCCVCVYLFSGSCGVPYVVVYLFI